MDRTIVYPGAVPLETDLLQPQRDIMVALGYALRMMLGGAPVVDELVAQPRIPASMVVDVGPGTMTSVSQVDAAAFGSLAASSDLIVKAGINRTTTSFSFAAPTTPGTSQAFLIQGLVVEFDDGSVVLPYFNAADPDVGWSGPNNSGVPQNTRRSQRVALQVKPGAPAAAGSQATPAADPGWVPLWVVTLNAGQTAITSSSIARHLQNPSLTFRLPQLRPGVSNGRVFNASEVWVVPAGVTRVRAIVTGAGGGGAGCFGPFSQSGGGGGAGGTACGWVDVQPGTGIPITVGTGGSGGGPGDASAGGPGQTGGLSSFSFALTATGGLGGRATGDAPSGGEGGMAGGGTLFNDFGGFGTDARPNATDVAGMGGSSFYGGGGRGGAGAGSPGRARGSGGGGCYLAQGNGGTGAPGRVVVEW